MSSQSKSSIEKTYICYICKARYKDRVKCKKHILSHKGKETNSNVKSELNIKPNGIIYAQKAIEEAKTENIIDEIKEEVKVEVKDEPIDNFEDQNDVNLSITDYLHHNNMKYKDMTYGNFFNNKGNLNKLQTMQTGEKPCRQLSIEQELINIEEEQKYQCSYCDKAFSGKENLDSHMISHTGESSERIYQCDWCDKAFTTKQYLSEHQKIHTAEKAYQCCHCDIGYSMKSILIRHMRTHIKENPYQCSYCYKTFQQTVNLCRHMRTHTGEKPYQNSHCDKTFSRTLLFFEPNEKLPIGVLPTKRNVLECLMYLLLNLLPLDNGGRMSVEEASDILAIELVRHWHFANIYTKGWKYVSKDIAQLYYDASNNLNYSARNKNKTTEHWKKVFNTEMERLFDIFCEDEISRKYQEEAVGVKMRKEDYDFLYDMRGERKMYCDNFIQLTRSRHKQNGFLITFQRRIMGSFNVVRHEQKENK